MILIVRFFSFFVKEFLFPAQFNQVLRNPLSDAFSFVTVLGSTFLNRCEIKILNFHASQLALMSYCSKVKYKGE